MKANRQKSGSAMPGKVQAMPKGKLKQTENKTNQPFSAGLDIYEISDPIDILSKFD